MPKRMLGMFTADKYRKVYIVEEKRGKTILSFEQVTKKND